MKPRPSKKTKDSSNDSAMKLTYEERQRWREWFKELDKEPSLNVWLRRIK